MTFGWEREFQRTTSLQNRWGRMVGTVSRVADTDTYLSYLLKVVPRGDPRGLHGHAKSHVYTGPDICEPTGDEVLV